MKKRDILINSTFDAGYNCIFTALRSILTIKELKKAWKDYLFNGGKEVRFHIYEEKEIFGREIYTYQDENATQYLIINGINVLADVSACFCNYTGNGDFEYWLDPPTHKFGKFDFNTNTFKLDL
jgi:hypothetical protein